MKRLYLLALLIVVGNWSNALAGQLPGLPSEERPPFLEAGDHQEPPVPFVSGTNGRCENLQSGLGSHAYEMASGYGLPAASFGEKDFHAGARQNPALRIAGKLSAIETFIGIRVDQLDAWRAYTSALMDILVPPQREGYGMPFAGAAKQAAPDTSKDEPSRIFGESLADDVLTRAAAANALKDKIAALRKVLTADQLERFKGAESSLDRRSDAEPRETYPDAEPRRGAIGRWPPPPPPAD